MSRRHLIETFNTHRMMADVVKAVATARDDELAEIMQAVRRAVSQPQQVAQHLIVYGERGSGKSFLMRMAEIEIEKLAHQEGAQVLPALLPEEQYNIRSAPQLIRAIASKVRGVGWEAAAYALEFRPLAEAWQAAVADLNAALDECFGHGAGLVVAMIENFDTLASCLFGAQAVAQKKAASTRALEQDAAEQLLRKLMNAKGSRLMLIAAATGTVDQDYERPLFQAFKTLDLHIWNSDDCIAYFNRRRRLEQQPALSRQEEARARAIAEFIGGNPRLAQLLGETLATPDALSIAATLDALSDHLADYYRRRLDDLPLQSAALLDALIRKGEPCTQTELAARVGAHSQAQIADAFRHLQLSRLLAAVPDLSGAGKLYRLRDRLFVHFYRRRYGEPDHSHGLAPIAELLESFFTLRERERHARHHLEAGEWTEARLYALNCHFLSMRSNDFDGFSDAFVIGTPPGIFHLAGLDATEAVAAQAELKLQPLHSVNRWKMVADRANTGIGRAAAAVLESIALSRCQMDNAAEDTLNEALQQAEEEGDPDAQTLVLELLANFVSARREDESRSLALRARAGALAGRVGNSYVKVLALLCQAICLLDDMVPNGDPVAMANEAANLAEAIGFERLQISALRIKASGLSDLKRYGEAAAEAEKAANLAESLGAISHQVAALIIMGDALSMQCRHEAAESTFSRAAKLAAEIGMHQSQGMALAMQSISMLAVRRPTEALAVTREALAINRESTGTLRAAAVIYTTVLQAYFSAASYTAADDLLQFVEEGLGKVCTPESARPFAAILDQVLAAVAYNNAWDDLVATLLRHEASLPWLKSPNAFFEAGRVWSAHVKAQGRSETYALIAGQLPAIVRTIELLPLADTEADGHWRSLIAGLVSYCDDGGFLQDLSELLKGGVNFDARAQVEPEVLELFAKVHTATDKETVLQRLDPDAALAVRRILGLPEPKTKPVRKGGRRKGR